MQILLKDKISSNPAFVSCSLFKLNKERQADGATNTTKTLLKTIRVVYSTKEEVLTRRCEKYLRGEQKIDLIEVKLIREW